MKTFADRLQSVLDAQKVKQTELAAYLEVSKQAVSGWAKGVTFPNSENLKKIAEFLKVDLNWLVRGVGAYSLVDVLVDKVSESDDHYSPYCLLPVVSKICKDIYDPANEIRRELCDKLTVKSEWFFLQMPDDHCNTGGTKCVKKGDLLLINPVIEDLYPGDLIAIATRSDRQWVRFIQNIGDIAVQLVGGITIKREDIAAMYRVIRVRPAEFGV